MYPVIPGVLRTAANSFEFGGYTVPAKSKIIVSNTVAHHLPQHLPDPERFDIDRFSPERAEHSPPGVFAPFGLGTHRCLGSNFAEVQVMATIANIVREAELALERPNRRLKVKYAPTYHPSFKVRLVCR